MSNLYIIPTPIGNLEDLTLRAIRLLGEVSTILCEDTRVSSRLLNHLEIKDKKLISCHEHNESKRIQEVIELLDAGEDLALISDAGTPLISDPGSVIIQALAQTEHKVTPLPGACAATTALSACPFNTERFSFEGFLPNSGQHRRRVLKKINERLPEGEEQTLVFYESPHRITKTLKDLEKIFEDKELEVFLGREITKKFEEFYLGSPYKIQEELALQFKDKIQGEFVMVLSLKAPIQE